MYISVADSRANDFTKWADAYQSEKLGDVRDGAVIATPALAQAAAVPAEQPHRPWLVPGPGRL
jgi:hypothetical protein